FESSNVNLFESNAIAYYLSNAQLRGGNDESSQSQVLQWVSFASTDLWPAVFAWVLPATGCSNNKQTLEPAKNQVKNLLKMLNDYLLSRTYLVGERITLADICMAVTLLPLYQHVLEPSVRDQYGNVNRYFMTLLHQKQFADVIGKVELCTTVKQVSQNAEAKPKKEKKEPKQENKAPVEDDAGDDLMPAMPKPKDPFEKFPKGKFDMDDFKRFYSNNPEDKSIPYFWEKFDKENYSIWYCEYKYPEELTKVFMSCNLISGMFQRLDRMRKNAFA
ncbi:elongation factor 1-gamma-like protein, partial [Euroglyphus maynei]